MKRNIAADSDPLSLQPSEKKKKSTIIQELGYTDEENPFNDKTLSDKFVWTKKDPSTQYDYDHDQSITDTKKNEILKIKQQRLERELEKRRWEMERERVFREREAERFDEYEQKELGFHLKQANLASFIRLKEKRPKLLDFIINNMKYLRYKDKLLGEDYDSHLILSSEHERIFGVEYKKPHEILYRKNLKDLLESQEDLQTMIECDTDYQEFWRALNVIMNDEINYAKEREKRKENAKLDDRTKPIHESVVNEIKELLSGKNMEELLEMEKLIDDTLDNRDASTDVEYWEGLKKYLQIYKARAFVEEYHNKALEVYSEMKTKNKLDRIFTHHTSTSEYQAPSSSRQSTSHDNQTSNEEEKLLREFRNKESEDGDEDAVEEVKLVNQQYAWNDKYRPRKPKYFNRVRTGYEWTKYNRTHYDHENPPPKVIQGYKFNIFYPDLIDKSNTPSFKIERDPTSDEFSILRFQAGPPYEDICFRIVNREWERSYKRGYKCVFERGVLQLHFKFKKLRFRY
ncbi:hypothetical protein C9374_011350 [Naegleria lovaniensis]|uniref:Splicing factor Cactin n=1 Tax=Naegleria lovaniensis TaxID=51637 RepID=A0AA88H0J5_NAELO|nr:uncharacterized protein C9374_011350 [Naegleria lovaniensis]KAG2392625.1 hypothetical protein C9374_011350 [Naegleria lovaniensis]